jgi:hypothetical protein
MNDGCYAECRLAKESFMAESEEFANESLIFAQTELGINLASSIRYVVNI